VEWPGAPIAKSLYPFLVVGVEGWRPWTRVYILLAHRFGGGAAYLIPWYSVEKSSLTGLRNNNTIDVGPEAKNAKLVSDKKSLKWKEGHFSFD
jgi:hypothetical protein